jgi:CheY-like chemotaxis protein
MRTRAEKPDLPVSPLNGGPVLSASRVRLPDAAEALLLVEDDCGIRDLILALLSNLQPHRYTVRCVGNGEEALRELRLKEPAVIVLDLLLPGTNGFDVLRELKALKPHLLARVIVITAASEQTMADFPEKSSIHRLLRKPFDAFELVRLITECGALA